MKEERRGEERRKMGVKLLREIGKTEGGEGGIGVVAEKRNWRDQGGTQGKGELYSKKEFSEIWGSFWTHQVGRGELRKR